MRAHSRRLEGKKFSRIRRSKNYRTRSCPDFVERFSRTFKDMLFKRVDADEKKGKHIQWVDYLGEILLTYNSKMIHSAHEMSPNEAHKKENHLKVKLKLEINRMTTRKYPTLRVGDEVKLYRKKAITEKERTSNWSSAKYTVTAIFRKNWDKTLIHLRVKKDNT